MANLDLRAELVRRQVYGSNIHAVVEVIEANGDRWTMNCELEEVGTPSMRTSIRGETEGTDYLNTRYGPSSFSQAVVQAVLDAPEGPFEQPSF